MLPLDRNKVNSIAMIGKNADTGMISGGGSAQVDPPGRLPTKWQEHVWFPTSPLKAIAAKAPGAQVRFAPGKDLAAAAALAKSSDVAIVFAYQWESEGMDLDTLSLPDNQDALIAAVAAANPQTIVVLETGTAVTMPWVDKVERRARGVVRRKQGRRRGRQCALRRREPEREAAHDLPLDRGRPAASDAGHAAAGRLGQSAVAE